MKKYMRLIIIFIFSVFIIINAESLPDNPNRYFSPNLDGSKDVLRLYLGIKDDGLIAKWRFLIYDTAAAEKPIREYESRNSKEILHMTAKKFTSRILEKKAGVEIPKYVEWDGIDKNNIRVKDGLYYYVIEVVDEAGNKFRSKPVPIVLDTVFPVAVPKYRDNIFSPNNDNAKEIFTIDLTLADVVAADTVKLSILDVNNKSIKQYSYRGQVPSVINWDGTADNNSPADEGIYKCLIETSDYAGNQYSETGPALRLVRTIEDSLLEVRSVEFSPNQDGYFDDLPMQLDTSSEKGLESWALLINNNNGKTVKTFNGKKELTKNIIYNGLDDSAKQLPDGEYKASLKLQYDSGNHPVSVAKSFTIDTMPPEITVEQVYKYQAFNPEGDSEKKDMRFKQTVKGRGNETYKGIVYDSFGNIVISIDYEPSVPEYFVWDGKNAEGTYTEGVYRYVLTGIDKVGNESKAESPEFFLRIGNEDIRISTDTAAFSPNGDGVKDNISFTVTATHVEDIISQTITVKSEQGKIVKEFKKEKYTASLVWDGKDSDGKTAADGKYIYELQLSYQTGQKPKIENKILFVDTEPVDISITLSDNIFSPNNDGNKDNLLITQIKKPSLVNDQLDRITAFIKNSKGTVYKKVSWQGSVPDKLKWNGKDQVNDQTPDGEYIYSLETSDSAGNNKIYTSKKFILVNKMETIEAVLSRETISPGTSDSRGRLDISARFSSTNYLEKWTAYLMNSTGARFDVFNSTDPAEIYKWDGSGLDKKIIPNGEYFFFIEALYTSGNNPSSFSKDLLIDSVPPLVEAHISPKYFSPDNDGVDDTLRFGLKVSDKFGTVSWDASLYRKDYNLEQTFENYQLKSHLFKQFSGKGNYDDIITWDGKGESGDLVESANDYIFFIKAVDRAGNITIKPADIAVDVLIERLADGRLRIIINSITFKLNSAKLIGNYKRTLDRLIYILDKFPEYDIKIVGHTDYSTGTKKRNMELSRERALSVYKYLIQQDVSKDRLSYDGKGPNEPYINPEENDEDMRRNRRVEFFLEKPE